MWLVIAVAGYGGLGGGYHFYLSSSPNRIAIVVDSSFNMRSVWGDVPKLVERVSREKYAEYAVMSEKRVVHTWRDTPSLGNLSPYAPLSLDKVAGFDPIDEADQVIFITNASSDKLKGVDWDIVRGKGW